SYTVEYPFRFLIKTDNKALEFIFKRSGKKTPLRIERWAIRLNEYDFKKPLETQCDGGKKSNVELFVNYVFEQSVPSSITNEEVAKETANDPVLQELIGRIRGKKVNSYKRLSKNFDNVFHELTVTELNSFLGTYRTTPHSSTWVPPASLIFRFCNTSKLTTIKQNEFESNDLDRKARENDENAKFKMKEYAEKKLRCRRSDLEVEDLVWYKRLQSKGSLIAAKSSTGEQVTRNSSFFKKIEGKLENSSEPNLEEEVESPGEASGTLPRRSSRFGPGHIDKLQLNREKFGI
ncbi:unnamed protein product, partial [Brachionus calyciflorus]